MKSRQLINKIMVALSLCCVMTLVQAGKPLWTLTPLTLTTVSVDTNSNSFVSYQVTNQSRQTYGLEMKPIPGISQVTTSGRCPNQFFLSYQQSCVLTLLIDGNVSSRYIDGGPIICNEGNPNQCYQPNIQDSLHINITEVPAEGYTVGGSVSGLSGTLVLENNLSDALTLVADGNFTFSEALSPGSTYVVRVQTQPATQTCSVSNGTGIITNHNVNDILVHCVTNTNTTLSASLSRLALSVTGLTEYGISGTPSSGLPRIITITNTGVTTATNLLVSTSSWPTGTFSSTNCGSTLAALDNCMITITPGSEALILPGKIGHLAKQLF